MKQEKLVLTPFSGGSPAGLSLGARVRKEGSVASEGKKKTWAQLVVSSCCPFCWGSQVCSWGDESPRQG